MFHSLLLYLVAKTIILEDPKVAFIVPLLTGLCPLWPVPSAVVCHCDPVASKAKIRRKLDKASLEDHQEGQYFEISDNHPSVIFMFQRTQNDLDTALFLFEQHRMNQGKRCIHIPVMK